MSSNSGNNTSDKMSTDEFSPQPPVTEQQKELAQQAMAEFEKGSFGQCAKTMSQLAGARPTDVKVVLNRSVALFYQSQMKQVDEFRHNIHTVFNMARISPDLSEKSNLDDSDYAVVYYNKAVVLYHEKQYRTALAILERLFKYIEPIDEALAQKVMLLLTELYLIVHQPYDALHMVSNVEKFLSGKNQSSQDKDKNDSNSASSIEALRAKLTLYKVRCSLMSKVIKNKKDYKSLQGNSQPVNYAKANYEYLKGNLRKAAKILGNPPNVHLSHSTGECLAVMYANNQALINMCLQKPNIAICQVRDALQYNEKVSKDTVPNDKVRPPLQLSYVSRHYQLLHNLGVLQLHARRPSPAFDCFYECVQVYHRNPRLWLRLAECCIMHFRENNDIDREHTHRLDVVQSTVGSGIHRKLILGQGLDRDRNTNASGGVVPALNLSFASFCLRNAYALLPKDPLDAKPVPQDAMAESGPPPTYPMLLSAEPGNPLQASEVANLRCSILTASAYVCLCTNDFLKALHYAVDLLRQPNLTGAQRYLGHMYKGEALVALDRIADAVTELNPENIKDVSTTLPEVPSDPEKEQEPLAQNRESIVKWLPNTVQVARALMQYNLAVTYANRTEFDKALFALTESSDKVGPNLPVQMYYLKLYLDLKQGNKKEAVNFINKHFNYGSRN
ncbi:hypothetical protein EGW08_000202 [Elysia chlorotica]|uniref:CCR4-NOT transcription complex subunit 10 n=1 Tax=Elysia chlorotica TaxID=188477 RepID=A0A3S1A1I8_ELYCH|nr:hypothetical protein EGW08_000202 [Elysia chlorotica]